MSPYFKSKGRAGIRPNRETRKRLQKRGLADPLNPLWVSMTISVTSMVTINVCALVQAR